jgi:hypothetical protein
MSGYMRELEGDGERLAIGGFYIRQPPKETEFANDNPGVLRFGEPQEDFYVTIISLGTWSTVKS